MNVRQKKKKKGDLATSNDICELLLCVLQRQNTARDYSKGQGCHAAQQNSPLKRRPDPLSTTNSC